MQDKNNSIHNNVNSAGQNLFLAAGNTKHFFVDPRVLTQCKICFSFFLKIVKM